MPGSTTTRKSREERILDAVEAILRGSGEPLRARQLCDQLAMGGIRIEKTDLNSILYGPGKDRGLTVANWAWSAPSGTRGERPPRTRPAAPAARPGNSVGRPGGRGRPPPAAPDTGDVVLAWPAGGLVSPSAAADQRAISWTAEQLAVIERPVSDRVLVVAAPGTGKTAVACARVARLISTGTSPSSIMMFSFTRAAVSELRDRVAARAASGEEDAAAVRITTLDSAAWFLNRGLGEPVEDGWPPLKGFGENIQEATRLFRTGNPELCEYIERFDHVVVDEAQDLVDDRAELVLSLLLALRPDAGFTVFADPAQAIYDFTRDDDNDDPVTSEPFVARLQKRVKKLGMCELTRLHRARNSALSRFFAAARKAVMSPGTGETAMGNLSAAVSRHATPIDVAVEDLPEEPDQLILFRRRSDVLLASSYLSSKRKGISRCHRLRLSGFPQPIHPWVGVLLWDHREARLTEGDFRRLWDARLSGKEPPGASDAAWKLLFRAAGTQRGIDVRQLISQLARPRPPFEFCLQDVGGRGPVLGTVHASKGRQASNVVLLLPVDDAPQLAQTHVEEEARVLYVGATRAQGSLRRGKPYRSRFERSNSGRVFRSVNGSSIQFEVGRVGDVEFESVVATDVVPDEDQATEVQALLANGIAHMPCRAELDRASGWNRYLLWVETARGPRKIGTLAQGLVNDLRVIARSKGAASLAPPFINHLWVYGVCTVAVDPDDQRTLGLLHERYRHTGLFLAPLIKGFVTTKLTRNRKR
jgi:hypothetical protein